MLSQRNWEKCAADSYIFSGRCVRCNQDRPVNKYGSCEFCDKVMPLTLEEVNRRAMQPFYAVLAGSYQEYQTWKNSYPEVEKNNIKNSMFVTCLEDIFGHDNIKLVYFGTWFRRINGEKLHDIESYAFLHRAK